MRSAFWDDHDTDLTNPEYARAFAAESVRVATIDAVMNRVADQLDTLGMSRAELARAIGANPASLRRLLSSGSANPTLGTLAEIAAALGMKVALEPMSDAERESITTPMTKGIAKRPSSTEPGKVATPRKTAPRRNGKDLAGI